MRMMRTLATIVVCAITSPLLAASAQLAPPNARGVAMGHLHYIVRDVEANRRFWVELGGEFQALGTTDVIRFPDLFVFLDPGDTSGGTEGSIVNHVAFRVEALGDVEARGFDVGYLDGYIGIGNVHTPGGERIELFDNTATNLTFTPDDGQQNETTERHNRSINIPIIAHHIHLYVPEGSELEARNWYVRMFGGTAGTRGAYRAVDLPGINLNFSGSPEPLAPTRGRMLDHIGFEILNLEAFCRNLEALGVEFERPYAMDPSGFGTALLSDPWGTTIELTEGLRGL